MSTSSFFVVLFLIKSFWSSCFEYIVLVSSSTAMTSYSLEKYLSFLLSSCQYQRTMIDQLKCKTPFEIWYGFSFACIIFGSLSSIISWTCAFVFLMNSCLIHLYLIQLSKSSPSRASVFPHQAAHPYSLCLE